MVRHLLTQGNPSFTVSTPTATATNSGRKSSNNIGAIVGGAVGGAVGLGIMAFLAFLIARKFKDGSADTDFQPAVHSHQPPQGVAPHEDPFATPPDKHAGRVTGYAQPQMGYSGTSGSGPSSVSRPSYISSPQLAPSAINYSGRAEAQSPM